MAIAAIRSRVPAIVTQVFIPVPPPRFIPFDKSLSIWAQRNPTDEKQKRDAGSQATYGCQLPSEDLQNSFVDLTA
jgi:hypothetical protein